MTMIAKLKAAVIAAGPAVSAAIPAAHADEQYFPLQSYRVGPYAAGGTGFFGGFIDYLNLINTRDGGVNGVKLTWSEAETQYEVERGVGHWCRVAVALRRACRGMRIVDGAGQCQRECSGEQRDARRTERIAFRHGSPLGLKMTGEAPRGGRDIPVRRLSDSG